MREEHSQDVLEAVLGPLMDVSGASSGRVLLRAPQGRLKCVASVGELAVDERRITASPVLMEALRLGRPVYLPGGLPAEQGAGPVAPAEVPVTPAGVLAEVAAAGALAALPLRPGDNETGMVLLGYAGPHPFPEQEQRVLAALAAQGALAYGRARTVARLQRQLSGRPIGNPARAAQAGAAQPEAASAISGRPDLLMRSDAPGQSGLEHELQAQAAFASFTEAAGTQTDVLTLAARATEVLLTRFPGASAGYYEPEDGRWKARVWSGEVAPAVLAQMRAGFGPEVPMIARVLQTGEPTFTDAWDPEQEGIEQTGEYDSVGNYPLNLNGEIVALLSVGQRGRRVWQDLDRQLLRAVGRSLNLALERAEQARQLDAERAALEAFAAFTERAGTENDVSVLVCQAAELLRQTRSVDVGYYERDGELFRLRQWTDGFPADLLARSQEGYSPEQPGFARAAATRAAVFLEHWNADEQGVQETGSHGAVAFQPFFQGGQMTSVLVMGGQDTEVWNGRDQGIFRAVGRSLTLALERSQSARRALEEARAQQAFVAFTENASQIGDIGALSEAAFQTLQALFPGSSAVLYSREDGLWKAQACSPDMASPLVAVLGAGLPAGTPILAQAARDQGPVFVDHWSEAAGEVAHTGEYRTAAVYPVVQNGEFRAALTVALRGQECWSERDRGLVLAVGRSFSLLYDRVSVEEALRERQHEAESRTRALQAFARLTAELGVGSSRAEMIRQAQEVLMSLLPPGYAAFWEVRGERWHATSQVGHVGNPELQAVIEAGLPVGGAPTLDLPATTRQPYFQDAYVQGTDTPPSAVGHIRAVACVPLLVGGEVAGIMTVPLFQARHWSPADRAVLTTVVQSLGLVLERAESVLQLAQRSAQLERTNAELQGANEELEAFAYSVSHDLRTPVRHIMGFNQLLHKTLDDRLDDKARRYLRVIDEAASRMNTLIDTMLDLSRTSRQPLRMGPVDMEALVSSVRRELEPETAQRHIDWRVGPLPVMNGDAATLRLVVVNLLSNALKYTRTRPMAVIEVWAQNRDDEHALLVRDNGVGFDDRYGGRLFGVFQRLHRQDEFEGVGVGLANVRRIVMRHGGRVSAQGVPGEGATFSFTLPKAR